MVLDHVCVAVRSIDRAANRYCELFGYEIETEVVENTRQQVLVQFLSKEGSLDIKLIAPSNPKSPLVEFLKKGEGLHHVCFKVDDLESGVSTLQEKKARLLAGPEPGEAFCGENIGFVYAGHGLNVELIDTDCRANRKK